MKNKCEIKFFDLDTTLEPKSTLEVKVYFLKLVLVLEPFILEPKSTILSNHILLLDQGINHNDIEMMFQDWFYNWDDFNVRILHDSIQFRNSKTINRKEVIKGRFFENSRYLDWAPTLGPI